MFNEFMYILYIYQICELALLMKFLFENRPVTCLGKASTSLTW